MKMILRLLKRSLQRLFLKPFLDSISALPNGGLVTLFDIGAAEFIQQRWKVFTSYLNYVGFEPDERSYKDLLNNDNSKNCNSYNIFPYALWDSKTDVELNLCAQAQDSSMYLPKFEFLENFPKAERFDVVSSETVSVVPMDSLDLDNPDFIKLDIQGAELKALKGANSLLSQAIGLELEVEFIELYSNQPLFGDVCEFLSNKGFEFIDFVNLCRWEREDYLTNFGQCAFGDALFLVTPEKIDYEIISIDKLSAYFSVLVIYRRFDLIDKTLTLLPKSVEFRFEDFRKKVVKASNVDKYARRITSLNTSILNVMAPNYKSHLLY